MKSTTNAAKVVTPIGKTKAEDPRAEIARLRAENERLKAREAKRSTISFRVSEKGAVSVYGLGRFPVTLYQEQWEKIFGCVDELKAFIVENRAALKTKD